MFASLALLAAAPAPAVPAAAAIVAACKGRDGWSDPAPPARIYGNVYDVGTCGITVLLVATPAGLVLIDAGPATAAPLVAANIEALGFRLRDVRYLLNGHEHDDHAGGLAELQRRTGGVLVVRGAARRTIATGVPDPADPQAGLLKAFPGAKVGRIIADGGRLTLGGTVFTAHATPGHTPGPTSWTWRSCAARRCITVTYADSLTAVSAEGYRFTDHPAQIATLRATFGAVARLPCDLLVTPHPAASQLFERFAGNAPLIDPAACRRYAATARKNLDDRLAREAAK